MITKTNHRLHSDQFLRRFAAPNRRMSGVLYQLWLNVRLWPDAELEATLIGQVQPMTTQSSHVRKGSMLVPMLGFIMTDEA